MKSSNTSDLKFGMAGLLLLSLVACGGSGSGGSTTGGTTGGTGSTTGGTTGGTASCGIAATPSGPLMGGARQVALNNGGVVTTFAGAGISGNVTGIFASDVTTDGVNLYVTDTSSNRIQSVAIATGAVTTLAGSGTAGAADGTCTAASFNQPFGITTDGTNLYVADMNNNKIRKVVIATGAVSTLAGTGVAISTDGTGSAASFNKPMGITTDGTNLYVADSAGGKVRKIVIATGVVTTLAGTGMATGVTAASITTDGVNLYATNVAFNKIHKIVIATGAITTLAGSGAAGAVDGTGTAASFSWPSNITTDGVNLYVGDMNNNKIRKIVIATGVVTTLAGSGTAGAADGTGVAAAFNLPAGITTDGASLYVVDSGNAKIRKIQ